MRIYANIFVNLCEFMRIYLHKFGFFRFWIYPDIFIQIYTNSFNSNIFANIFENYSDKFVGYLMRWYWNSILNVSMLWSLTNFKILVLKKSVDKKHLFCSFSFANLRFILFSFANLRFYFICIIESSGNFWGRIIFLMLRSYDL